MKISNMLDFLSSGKLIVIVPNELEKKILIHRLMCSEFKTFEFIDHQTIRYNNEQLIILTIDEVQKRKGQSNIHCIIEFPELISEEKLAMLNKNFNTFILTSEIL